MISKTIGFRGTLFSDTIISPFFLVQNWITFSPHFWAVETAVPPYGDLEEAAGLAAAAGAGASFVGRWPRSVLDQENPWEING